MIDPNGDWVKISSVSTELTEGALDADGGRLPATRAVSLGTIWNPSAVPFPDLEFEIYDDVQAIPVTIELALDGDYSANQIVDSADYVVWRRYLNSIENLLADGDLDGVVNLDDLLVWRENFGITLPLPPYGSGSGGVATAGVFLSRQPPLSSLCYLPRCRFSRYDGCAGSRCLASSRHGRSHNYRTRASTSC